MEKIKNKYFNDLNISDFKLNTTTLKGLVDRICTKFNLDNIEVKQVITDYVVATILTDRLANLILGGDLDAERKKE